MLQRFARLLLVAGAMLWGVALFAQDALTAAPQNYRVLFENQYVRVLAETVPAGGQEAIHVHPGRVTYALTDSRLRFFDSVGTSGVQDTRAGDVNWSDAISHGIENSGAGTAEVIHFEIKTPPTRDFGDSPTLIGGTANVLIDNPTVRVTDLRLARGEKAISAQTANRIVFALSQFRGVAEIDARSRERLDADLHSVFFLGEGLDLIENSGKPEMHALVIELK
jgi:hypothetical protein